MVKTKRWWNASLAEYLLERNRIILYLQCIRLVISSVVFGFSLRSLDHWGNFAHFPDIWHVISILCANYSQISCDHKQLWNCVHYAVPSIECHISAKYFQNNSMVSIEWRSLAIAVACYAVKRIDWAVQIDWLEFRPNHRRRPMDVLLPTDE